MKKILFAAMVSIAGFIACQSAEEENTESSSVTTPTPAPATAATAPVTDSPAAVQVVPANPALITTPPPVPIAAAQPKLNPAHGMPGHRCDISVGAPLPAAGTAAAAVVPQQAPPVMSATQPPVQQVQPIMQAPPPPVMMQQPATSGAGKKLNPAHGQPGHRCDIAVGAPLN